MMAHLAKALAIMLILGVDIFPAGTNSPPSPNR
jgi:hypothetical protein